MHVDISKRNIRGIIIIILISLLCFLSVFFFNGKDCQDITNWAIHLLDSVGSLRIREFALICNDANLPTNYSAFSNIVCGIWIAPIYIIGACFDISIPLAVYCTWMKVGVCVLNILAALLLSGIIKRNSNSIKTEYVVLLWFSFNLVQQYSIGNGQIDIIGIVLFLVAFSFFLDNRLTAFSVISGICLCFKAFPILIIGMLFAYIFADKGVKVIKYVVLLCIFPVLQYTIEKVFFIDYDICERVGFEYSNANFIDRLFEGNVNISVSPVIMIFVILCVLVYLLGKGGLIDVFDALAMSALYFFIFFLLVESHCQWYMYLLPLILIIGIRYGMTSEFLLLCFGLNISQIIYNSSTTEFIGKSLYGIFKESTGEFDYNMLFTNVRHMPEYVASVFFAFMGLTVLYYVVTRVRIQKGIELKREQKEKVNAGLIYAIYTVTLLSELILIVMY